MCTSALPIHATTVWRSAIKGTPRVAVVGAGAAGLTTAKALLEAGIEPTVFEASTRIGGLWASGEGASFPSPSYASLITNTSKQITAFSDFPFPPAYPDFPSRDQVSHYLDAYADAFGLRSHVRLDSKVLEVRPDGATWEVVIGGGTDPGVHRFDAVLVASGIFRRASMPEVPGLDTFRGQTMHSLNYEQSDQFAGRSVVVVGLGSSAVDIATDLVGVAERVIISVRRGAWVVPRTIEGRPLDHRGTRTSQTWPVAMRTRRRRKLIAEEFQRRAWPEINAVWRHASVPFNVTSAPSVTTDRLIPAITSDKMSLMPGIERVVPNAVEFINAESPAIDDIIAGTGYTFDFPFLSLSLWPWRSDRDGLYRLIFPPDALGLGFIGVCRAHGPILPIVEMQARWAARVLSGQRDLPNAATMRHEIQTRVSRQRARGDSPVRVALLPYLDSLAVDIGVRPNVWHQAALLRPLLLGPPIAAQYRLQGPDSWDGATNLLFSTYM